MRTNRKTFAAAAGITVVVIIGLLIWSYTQAKNLGEWPGSPLDPTCYAAQNKKLDADIVALKVQLEIKPILEKLLPIAEKESNLARRILPSRLEPHEISDAIREKAHSSGIYLRSIAETAITRGRRGSITASGGPFIPVGYQIRMEGSYDQIATFVNKIEDFERADDTNALPPGEEGELRFFRVIAAEISPKSSGLSPNEPHTASVTLATYRYTGED